MDGYIKNKKIAIKAVRKTILIKYSITFLIIIFIPVWLFALAVNQPPEDWTHTDVVYSHISLERVGLTRGGRSYVLNTQDARKFVIKTKYIDINNLSENLIPGNTYHLVFSDTIAGGYHIEALYDDRMIFRNSDDSIAQWKSEQREAIIAIIVTVIIEILALILIDRLWCKEEYSQINKLKADILRREECIRDK